MTDTMLAKAALAVERAYEADTHTDWMHPETAKVIVHAVLAAIRTPDAAMLEAMQAATIEDRSEWHAAIDAILAEEPAPHG